MLNAQPLAPRPLASPRPLDDIRALALALAETGFSLSESGFNVEREPGVYSFAQTVLDADGYLVARAFTATGAAGAGQWLWLAAQVRAAAALTRRVDVPGGRTYELRAA